MTITSGHVRAFQLLSSPRHSDDITLAPCTINGEPGVAIVLMERISETQLAVMPLFVAILDSMNVDFPDRHGGSGSGGGPKRAREAFRAAQADVTASAPA